ncbi:30S ribosomal protein S6e [Candidatus Woesearchaeota archaeon]|nr:30S ribosomal protein S6e [Candidatus Woesearchaeota archaeon]
MAEYKLVIGTKDGKSYQKELKSPEADLLFDKKVGDKISGDAIGFPGYEFEVTGGSDKSGFPMRKDVSASRRKKIFTTSSHGVWIPQKGKKVRKTVAGNMVHENTAQINLKVLKEGKAPLAPVEAQEEQSSSVSQESSIPAKKAQEEEAEKTEAKPAETKEEKTEAKPAEASA